MALLLGVVQHNFKVISDKETEKEICKKVQFTVDTKVLQKQITSFEENNHKSIDILKGDVKRKSICWRNGYARNGYYDLENFLKKYTQEEEKPISMGVIIDNKTTNLNKVKFNKIGDEIEQILVGCLVIELGGKVKIIERSNLKKILEEYKHSGSGITDGSLKLGKIENLDIIFHRIIYNDRFTTKLLNVETGEVLYVSTNNIIKEENNNHSDIIDNKNNKSQKITKKQSSVSEKDSSDWVEYTKTKKGDIFYYKKRNVEKSKGKYIVQLWEKQVYSDDGREKIIKMWRDNGLSTEGWEKLSQSIILSETDCKNNMKKVLNINLYDTGSNILYSSSPDNQKWNYIVSDSVNENLLKQVCK